MPPALRNGSLRELGVALAGEALVECEQPPSQALARACSALVAELPAPLPDGYRSEVCLRIEPWIAGIGACLERGVLLLFEPVVGEALLLGFFELRGNGLDAKVVGVGLRNAAVYSHAAPVGTRGRHCFTLFCAPLRKTHFRSAKASQTRMAVR